MTPKKTRQPPPINLRRYVAPRFWHLRRSRPSIWEPDGVVGDKRLRTCWHFSGALRTGQGLRRCLGSRGAPVEGTCRQDTDVRCCPASQASRENRSPTSGADVVPGVPGRRRRARRGRYRGRRPEQTTRFRQVLRLRCRSCSGRTSSGKKLAIASLSMRAFAPLDAAVACDGRGRSRPVADR
jgi:hypothetical protein